MLRILAAASFAALTSLSVDELPSFPSPIPSVLIHRRAERSAALRSDPSREYTEEEEEETHVPNS